MPGKLQTLRALLERIVGLETLQGLACDMGPEPAESLAESKGPARTADDEGAAQEKVRASVPAKSSASGAGPAGTEGAAKFKVPAEASASGAECATGEAGGGAGAGEQKDEENVSGEETATGEAGGRAGAGEKKEDEDVSSAEGCKGEAQEKDFPGAPPVPRELKPQSRESPSSGSSSSDGEAEEKDFLPGSWAGGPRV